MFKAILIELLGVMGFSLLGAYIFWQARKEWLAENYYIAFVFGLLGVWTAVRLIWMSFYLS